MEKVAELPPPTWFYGLDLHPTTLFCISAAIQILLERLRSLDDDTRKQIVAGAIENMLLYDQNLDSIDCEGLNMWLTAVNHSIMRSDDYLRLAYVCKKIAFAQQGLQRRWIKNNIDADFLIKTVLDAKGVGGIAKVIDITSNWHSRQSMLVKRQKATFNSVISEADRGNQMPYMSLMSAAFFQEFERRVAPKRKGRAGRSVEGTTGLILDYFGVPTTNAPEHFTTGLEIDKWIRTKDRWIIGISCKRTLRERWKQAYTTDLDLLSRHKIRELWHVVTYDKDLSDEKITEIGSHKAVLYLPDDSLRLSRALTHPGMKNYVRPMTHFIDDLKDLL